MLWLNESVHPSFAPRYVELAQENHEHLSQWLSWPYFCKTEGDFNAFIQHSLHKYADNKSMNCAIEYKSSIVGNISFNTINHDTKKVEISAVVDNAASRAVCEHLGMELEGEITNAEKVGDRILSHVIYGLHRQ